MAKKRAQKKRKGLGAKARVFKKSVSGIRKSLSERAGRVADIILDDSCAGKRAKTRQITRETVSMLKDVRQRFIQGISARDFLCDAAYGMGKLSSMTKRATCGIVSFFKEK
jgi:hypothetical protein